MKLNINKYQVGGLIAVQPLQVLAQPITQASEQPANNTQSTQAPESSSKKGFGDDMTKELLGKAITTDAMKYKEMIDNAYYKYQSMPQIARDSAEGRRLLKIMKGEDFSIVNSLIRQKDMFQEGIDIVKANSAEDEAAVTDKGAYVFNAESGKFEEVTAEQYAKDLNSKERKLQAVTNSKLIELREFNSNLANNTQVFTVLKNAKGITQVQKEVDAYMNNIEKNTVSSTTNQYQKAKSQAVASAIKDVQDQVQDGIFNLKTVKEQSSNKAQLEAAVEDAWNGMSNSSKQVLKIRAAQQGVGAQDLEKAAKDYVILMFAKKSIQDIKEETTVSYESEMSKADKEKTSGAGAGEMGVFETLVSLKGERMPLEINVGNNISYKALGTKIGTYLVDNKPTGPMMASDMGELLSLVDKNSISIGGNPISFNKLQSVMYNGKDVMNVRLPVKTDQQGRIIPDFELAEKIANAQNEINTLRVKTMATMEQVYKKHGVEIDSKGQPKYKFDQFILFDGTAGEESFGDKFNQKLLTETSDDNTKELFDRLYEYGNGPQDKSHKKAVPSRGTLWWGDNTYNGLVAMRLTSTGQGARLVDKQGLTIPKSETTPSYYNKNAPQWSGTQTSDKATWSNFGSLNQN